MKTAERKEIQAGKIASFAAKKNAFAETYKDLKIVSYEIDGPNAPCFIAFKGTSAKALCHYRYRTEEQRAQAIEALKKQADNREANKAARSAKKAAVTNEGIEIGTIYYSSWGYEQTNIDFYQVTGKSGSKTLFFRPIAQTREYDRDDCGSCMPCPNEFTGEEFKKMINDERWINLTSYSGMCPWDGTSKGWSSWH